MIKVGIVGATGFAGEELIRILLNHPEVEIVYLAAKLDEPEKIGEIFPQFKKRLELTCELLDIERANKLCDFIFLALPHRVSMEIAPEFLKKRKRVVDLSADYRLKSASLYESWYKSGHKSPEYLSSAVYGLPEIYADRIKGAQLVANPGCYPTGIILGCAPLLKGALVDTDWIVIDSKSGMSGAGREAMHKLIPQMKDNFKAYKVNEHQHAAEINQELTNISQRKIEVIFTPHLLDQARGILSTIYLRLKKDISNQEALDIYKRLYEDKPLVKVLPGGEFPQIKDVNKTNYCLIGIKLDSKRSLIIVISAIDNLLKGASGQAVQNMNIMYGFKEELGLK